MELEQREAVVLGNTADGVSDIASALQFQLQEPISINGHAVSVTCSTGTATCFKKDADGMLQCSDAALYQAKKLGRNRIEAFSFSLCAKLIETKNRVTDLKEAISKRHIIPHYEIEIDARSRSIVGIEALARWDHAAGLR